MILVNPAARDPNFQADEEDISTFFQARPVTRRAKPP